MLMSGGPGGGPGLIVRAGPGGGGFTVPVPPGGTGASVPPGTGSKVPPGIGEGKANEVEMGTVGKTNPEEAPAIGGPAIGAVGKSKIPQGELDFAVFAKTSGSGRKLCCPEGQQGPNPPWHPLSLAYAPAPTPLRNVSTTLSLLIASILPNSRRTAALHVWAASRAFVGWAASTIVVAWGVWGSLAVVSVG